jgi:K+-dependent Na+/Ca+ exchanger-like protein
MKGIKGRFRTSHLARTFYVGAMLALMAVMCVMEAGRFLSKSAPQETPASAAQKSLTNSAHGRRLMSSGVELIPGFTGAKCGSNWYVDGTDPNTNKTKTYKYKKDEWEKSKYKSMNPSAYAQWEADSGGLIYVIASVYLFLGIAIICDAHFNDSLEMICSKFGLNLSEDVAGATFMAAGSSAPELATSFLGVFVAKSAVGLGTIIGSAVFNILIIIGSVAILVTEPLNLDYRPVIRDNFFYAVSVILLCVCLAVDDKANLVDTIILLIWYALYILFMAFNDQFMDKFFPREDEEAADDDKPASKDEAQVGAADAVLTPTMGDNNAAAKEVESSNTKEEPNAASVEDGPKEDKTDEKDEKAAEAAAPAEASKEGDTAKSDGGTGTGFGSGRGDTAPPEEEKAPKPESDGATGEATSAGDVELTVTSNAAAAETASDAKDEKPKDEKPEDKDKPKRNPSFSTQKFSTGNPEPANEETHECEGCCCWQSQEPDEDDEEDEPPSQCEIITDKVLFVFSWPWEMLFKYTMPYCHWEESEEDADEWDAVVEEGNKEKIDGLYFKQKAQLTCGQRWFWATFFLALFHITWVSFFMVEFMLKIGCLWGIPDVVMGLTFLAMGTSIPDALGSLAVAKKGEGDMAVSNAVGSNVFDICMGLGLPWFIKLCIDAGKDCDYIYICNASEDVLPSIFILLSIIVVLFAVFVFGKWKLYPQSGYVLFLVYGLFIVYQLLNTYVINKDPPTCTVPTESGYDKCAV